jgi:general secretion pathway protein A
MNFGMLTGEIGCGKTITRSVFKKRLSPIRFDVIDMENSNLPFNFIMLECIQKMSADDFNPKLADENIYYLLKEFKKLLKIKIVQRQKNLVIILDEAQQLSKEAIVELKNLTNITYDDQSYITVILMGQPELGASVRNLPQIDQRISLRYHLNPLREKDVDGYLIHRLKVAGHPDGDVFVPEAVQLLCQVTGGIPREINRICKLAMDRAFSLRLSHIDSETINSIVMDLYKQDGKIHG